MRDIRLLVGSALMLAALQACAPLIPSVLPLEGTRRAQVGTTSVGGALVYVGDYVRAPGVAAMGRVSHQFSDTFALGGDIGLGVTSVETLAGTRTYGAASGRIHASFTPDTDHVAIHGGVSGAGGNGGGSMALDIGARVGISPHARIDLWAGQSIGYTLAFFTVMNQLQNRSFFMSATSIGVGFRLTPSITIGPSLTMAFVANSDGGQPSTMNVFRPGFIPGIFISTATDRAGR